MFVRRWMTSPPSMLFADTPVGDALRFMESRGLGHLAVLGPGGLEGLMTALAGGTHQRYIDDPSTLTDAATVQDGNGILGHILGSKDVSRQVAAQASAQTGIDANVLKRMLPLVATLAMGALSKQTAGGARADTAAAAPGLLGMLTPLLDSNRDGSVADDVMGMVGKFLR